MIRIARHLSNTAAALALLAGSQAFAQEAPADNADAGDVTTDDTADDSSGDFVEDSTGGGLDLFSADTLTLMLDARLVLADGRTSFVDRGLGKTRFDGTAQGDFKLQAVPIEADLIWQPRFTDTFVGNVSVAWQKDQENDADLLEAYLTFNPRRSGNVGYSLKAGLYWPEISLEHATGGAWSTVYTITPSAINAWVGEEVKVVGAEATLHATLGEQDLSLTAGVFGFNDTSGTLLSFRGWALHDIKATAFGHFKLPPLNSFITHAQEHRTRSLIELDNRAGFYGRAEWRPSSSVVLNAFYYDNRGDPEAFNHVLQWGWRTRFLNLGLVADLGPSTRLIAQAMLGTTKMGFAPLPTGVPWVKTRFRSAFALVTHTIGAGAVTGRVETFDTRERGSQMADADESENGWAMTAAVRWPLANRLNLFVEALHVESERGTRTVYFGLPAEERQNVLQASVRFRW
jgi:hypothetical protein